MGKERDKRPEEEIAAGANAAGKTIPADKPDTKGVGRAANERRSDEAVKQKKLR